MAVALINLSSAACQVGVVPFIKLGVYYYAQVVTTDDLGGQMSWETNARIVERVDLLSVDTLPARIVGRDPQRQALCRCLDPMDKNLPPTSAWLYGPPGTGKTAVARHVAAARCNSPKKLCLYVNCWERPTLYSVLQALCQECRILDAEAQDTGVKTERLRQWLRDKSVLIILDEIDRPLPQQRDSIVYALLTLGRTGLFCISANVTSFFQLSERTRSRLQPRLLGFSPYTDAEIVAVLSQRAQVALSPSCCPDKLLQQIATLAAGDARVALSLLRQAAVSAERHGAGHIKARDLPADVQRYRQLKRRAEVDSLPPHMVILYDLIARHGPIPSARLRQLYLLQCHHRDLTPVAPRTFSKYLRALLQTGLVRGQYQPACGPGRVFAVTR